MNVIIFIIGKGFEKVFFGIYVIKIINVKRFCVVCGIENGFIFIVIIRIIFISVIIVKVLEFCI